MTEIYSAHRVSTATTIHTSSAIAAAPVPVDILCSLSNWEADTCDKTPVHIESSALDKPAYYCTDLGGHAALAKGIYLFIDSDSTNSGNTPVSDAFNIMRAKFSTELDDKYEGGWLDYGSDGDGIVKGPVINSSEVTKSGFFSLPS